MNSSQALNDTFSALSDPTRRSILTRLSQGDATVMELVKPFNLSQPAISKHIGVLRRAGLVTQEKEGRVRRCHLNARAMKEAAAWISHYQKFWDDRLGALASYLDVLEQEKKEHE